MSSRLKIVSKRMAQHLTTHTMIGNYKKEQKVQILIFQGIPK